MREKALEFARNNIPRPKMKDSLTDSYSHVPSRHENAESQSGISHKDFISEKPMRHMELEMPMSQADENFSGAIDSTGGGGDAYTL